MARASTFRLPTCLLILVASLFSGCQFVGWEAPPAHTFPVPPPPPDSILRGEDDGAFFGDDDDDEATKSELIPRRVLFGNPERATARISPDGKHLAYLAPSDGVLNLWVRALDGAGSSGSNTDKSITKSKKRPIRRFFWSYDNEHLVYLQDKGGDENWRAYSVSVRTGKEIDLSPIDGVRAEIQDVRHTSPNHILIKLNDRDKRYHDVYRVAVATGKRELVQKNDGEYASFITDDAFAVRYAVKPTSDGGEQVFIRKGDGFAPFLEIAAEDTLTTHVVGFDKSGKNLLLLDSRGRDTAALTKVPAAGGDKTIIAEHAKADINGVMRHPKTRAVEAVTSNYERKEWQFIDSGVKADMAALGKVARGDIEITSRTLDDKKWTVAFIPDNGPVKFYLFDRTSKKATFLFNNRSKLEGQPLATMRPVVIKAKDGLKMVSYLTLPAAIKGDRPPHPLPMVLFVHGGPWARDRWGYNPYHQWLADRGYAVLSVNYRGSTGFGKRHINLGDRQWSGTMHRDLIDALDWAVREHVAHPKKVAIMGGSYGGYSTLVGLTFTPRRFACGVDIVGPSNLVTLLSSIPPYWAPYLALFKKRVGDHTTEHDKKMLMTRSPISRADKIVRPLLIGQGANDPRVKQAESDQIVSAMQKNKIPVTYVLYPDEGHGFKRPNNKMSFNAVAEAFLGRCLGGASEPFGSDFEGASIQVPAGAELVPGLSSALSSR